jgi:septal ring factor EnvC (AmiA/AmiB activator)
MRVTDDGQSVPTTVLEIIDTAVERSAKSIATIFDAKFEALDHRLFNDSGAIPRLTAQLKEHDKVTKDATERLVAIETHCPHCQHDVESLQKSVKAVEDKQKDVETKLSFRHGYAAACGMIGSLLLALIGWVGKILLGSVGGSFLKK